MNGWLYASKCIMSLPLHFFLNDQQLNGMQPIWRSVSELVEMLSRYWSAIRPSKSSSTSMILSPNTLVLAVESPLCPSAGEWGEQPWRHKATKNASVFLKSSWSAVPAGPCGCNADGWWARTSETLVKLCAEILCWRPEQILRPLPAKHLRITQRKCISYLHNVLSFAHETGCLPASWSIRHFPMIWPPCPSPKEYWKLNVGITT